MNKIKFEKILSDWPAKILSLFIACVLFFVYNQYIKLKERPLAVPLNINVNENFVPSSLVPKTVRIVLRGESNAIYAILEDDIEATLDLSGFTSTGLWRAPVRIEKYGSALGINPLEISVDPSDVSVYMEPRVVKELPVVPSFRGYLDTGFELSSFKLEPSIVEASGPASYMSKLSDVTTEPIDLTGRSENFTVQTKLANRDAYITFSVPVFFEFSALVQRSLVYKTFNDLSISYINLDEKFDYSTTVLYGFAQLAGLNSDIESYEATDGLLEVDLKDITEPGSYTRAVVTRFPEEFSVELWSPMVVSIEVFEKTNNGIEETIPVLE